MSRFPVQFELLSKDPTGARRGRLHTPHGTVQTPMFMVVGTAGTVKALGPDDLQGIHTQVVLGNTYHLMLRPGGKRVAELGGLHKFMAWNGPILTDSGGFQVFSLGDLRTISEDAVTFKSHVDGSKHVMSPEVSMDVQRDLGSDIAMAFDECVKLPATDDEIRASLDRTTRWLDRCIKHYSGPGAVFGIIQGGLNKELRAAHAAEITQREMAGYAIGGLSVGEGKEELHDILSLIHI